MADSPTPDYLRVLRDSPATEANRATGPTIAPPGRNRAPAPRHVPTGQVAASQSPGPRSAARCRGFAATGLGRGESGRAAGSRTSHRTHSPVPQALSVPGRVLLSARVGGWGGGVVSGSRGKVQHGGRPGGTPAYRGVRYFTNSSMWSGMVYGRRRERRVLSMKHTTGPSTPSTASPSDTRRHRSRSAWAATLCLLNPCRQEALLRGGDGIEETKLRCLTK